MQALPTEPETSLSQVGAAGGGEEVVVLMGRGLVGEGFIRWVWMGRDRDGGKKGKRRRVEGGGLTLKWLLLWLMEWLGGG